MNVPSTSNQSRSNQKKDSSGRFVADAEQSQRAQELALQRAEAQRLERLMALYADHIVDHESPLAVAIAQGDYFMSKLKCQAYHKKYYRLK